MKILRAGAWFSLCMLFALGAASCDGGDGDVSQITGLNRPDPGEEVASSGASCVPGQVATCVGVCSAFGLGYQVCAADGRSYGACQCPPLSDLNMGVETMGGATLAPPRFDTQPGGSGGDALGVPGSPVARAAIVGATCVRDGDCGAGLTCFEAANDSLGVGGPAGGYCTMGCDSDISCTDVDRNAGCGVVGGRQLCLRRCQSQDPADGENKCLERADLTCTSAAALGDEDPSAERQFGICVPGCQSDAACGGRRCDLSTGLCSDAPRPGAPIGAACTDPASCAAGICLGASEDSPGLCSAFCTLGVPGCGYDGSEDVIGAACLLPQVPTEGAGDRGLCFELCEEDANCTGEGFVCVPEPSSPRGGVCLPPPVDAPEGPDTEQPPSSSDGENLGSPCEADADCGGDLVCLAETDSPFGTEGGPPSGYCSFPCDAADDCPGDGDAACAFTDGGGYCLAACAIQTPGECQGRTDVQCAPFGFDGVCLPACSADEQCGGERVCDPVNALCIEPGGASEPECVADADCAEGVCDLDTGTCVAEPAPACTSDGDCAGGTCDLDTGECTITVPECALDAECDGVCDVVNGVCAELPFAPIGSACALDVECTGADASEDDTRLCLAVDESAFCSGICLWGTPFGCEAYGTKAFCVLPVQDDIGACAELCNGPEDCSQAGYECVPVGTTINDFAGACLPPVAAAPAEEPAADEPVEPLPEEPTP